LTVSPTGLGGGLLPDNDNENKTMPTECTYPQNITTFQVFASPRVAARIHITQEGPTVSAKWAGVCPLSGVRYGAGVRVRRTEAQTWEGISLEGYVPTDILSMVMLQDASPEALLPQDQWAAHVTSGFLTLYARCRPAAWSALISDLDAVVPAGSTLWVIAEGWTGPEVSVHKRDAEGKWVTKRAYGTRRSTKQVQGTLRKTAAAARMYRITTP